MLLDQGTQAIETVQFLNLIGIQIIEFILFRMFMAV